MMMRSKALALQHLYKLRSVLFQQRTSYVVILSASRTYRQTCYTGLKGQMQKTRSTNKSTMYGHGFSLLYYGSSRFIVRTRMFVLSLGDIHIYLRLRRRGKLCVQIGRQSRRCALHDPFCWFVAQRWQGQYNSWQIFGLVRPCTIPSMISRSESRRKVVGTAGDFVGSQRDNISDRDRREGFRLSNTAASSGDSVLTELRRAYTGLSRGVIQLSCATETSCR